MRKTIAAATAAASLTVGGLAGAVLGAPTLAGAADTTSNAVGWVQDALGGLVSDGTLTQAQADAVQTALDDARPERGHGRGGLGRSESVAAAAQALGITEAELRTQLEAGNTIAEVASARGVDVQAVIDAVVAAQQARLAQAVADGDLTQAEADEELAEVEERVADLVNREDVGRRGGFGRHHHDHDEAGSGDADPDTTVPGTTES